jgi:nucleoside triphosphate diphosphatase
VNESQPDPSVPSVAANGALDRAVVLVEFLRARCPWDAAQTHHTLRRYLLEEAHEVVEAIDARDDDALRDELGDLLLNLAFQVVIAEERSAFGRQEVVAGLEAKMRRRHPHIYGDSEAVAWETLKAAERDPTGGGSGLLDQLVPGTDPLAHAHRVQARVATVGFDWSDPRGAWEKVHEEVQEVRDELAGADAVRLEEEIGDLLFAVVNLARLAGVHPSTALTRANVKFTRRFRRLEELARARELPLETAGLEALDALWGDVKEEEG